MKTRTETHTIMTIKYNMETGLLKPYCRQRKPGIYENWRINQLMSFIFNDLPITNSIAMLEDENEHVYKVVEGQQRIDVICNFLNDKFALASDFGKIEVNGVEYDLSGKKYSQLDPSVQEFFLSRGMNVIVAYKYTEKEVTIWYKNINSGKPHNRAQLRVVIENTEFLNMEYKLSQHNCFKQALSQKQLNNDMDRDIVRQLLMLISADKGMYTLKSFSNNDLDAFVEWYNENFNKDDEDTLLNILDASFHIFDNKIISTKNGRVAKVKANAVIFVLYGMYLVLKNNKDVEKYVSYIKDNFIADYENQTAYKDIMSKYTSTTSADNILERKKWIQDIVNNL